MSTTNPPAPPASPRQVLLGLFILFQLAFLIVSNLLGLVKWAPSEFGRESKNRINQVLPQFADEQGHGWSWGEQLDTCIRRYVQLTGQDQEWALFAPTVGKATAFPAVLLLWDMPLVDDASIPGADYDLDPKNGFTMAIDLPPARFEFMKSENEPADMNAYLRIGKCRVRRYEGQFYLNPRPDEHETEDDLATRLTGKLKKFRTDYHDSALEYLRWRLNAWKAEHPDRSAPKQVVLLERFFRIRGPEEERGWDSPVLIPMFRWLPDHVRKDNDYVLDVFDFSTKQFMR